MTTRNSSAPPKMAHGLPIPASMATYNFAKCDPCSLRKKGPCDGNSPCGQCVARGKAAVCTHEIAKKRLEEEKGKMGAVAGEKGQGEGKTKNRKRGTAIPEDTDDVKAIADSEIEDSAASPAAGGSNAGDNNNNNDEDDDQFTTPPGVLTRRQRAALDAEAALAAATEAEPQYTFKLPAVLAKWDHKKCDRCRKLRVACDGQDRCANCVEGKTECRRKEGGRLYNQKWWASDREQRVRFEQNLIKAKEKAGEQEEKRKELLRKREIELSVALDEKWRLMREIRKEKKKLRKERKAETIAKKKQEEKENATPKETKVQVGADDDVEMEDADASQEDEGYQTQDTPAPASEHDVDSDSDSGSDLSELSDSEIIGSGM